MNIFYLIFVFIIFYSCSREIGDECSSNIDCGSARLCDLSQTDGYCTISPCEEKTCPSEAVCIVFQNNESYCMRKCKEDDDCRENYVCVKNFGKFPFCNSSR